MNHNSPIPPVDTERVSSGIEAQPEKPADIIRSVLARMSGPRAADLLARLLQEQMRRPARPAPGPHFGAARHTAALTFRQREILLWIQDFIAKHEIPPTIREIGRGVGITSTNGVLDHLHALERKGVIVRGEMISRGIRLVEEVGGR